MIWSRVSAKPHTAVTATLAAVPEQSVFMTVAVRRKCILNACGVIEVIVVAR